MLKIRASCPVIFKPGLVAGAAKAVRRLGPG
ncbi:hypothetical protein ACSSV6_000565 [Roseovarius sp. MBR-38]